MTCMEFIGHILLNVYDLNQEIVFFDKRGNLYEIDKSDENCFDSINADSCERYLDTFTVTIKKQ